MTIVAGPGKGLRNLYDSTNPRTPLVWLACHEYCLIGFFPVQGDLYWMPMSFLPWFLEKWSEADGTCSRSIACSCWYHAWVMCCILKRWRWVPLVIIVQVIAPLQDRINWKNLWPPQLPHLTSPNMFLWGYLKERVYRNKPCSIDAFKDNIWLVIAENDILCHMVDIMQCHVQMCLAEGSGHIQHLM